jgi:hypothetical protein
MKQILNSDFFTHITNHTAFIILTVERGDGVVVQDVHTDLCKSFRVTDTMVTTPCGNHRRDTVDSISNSYQRSSGYTSKSENLLSQLMVL